jgi:hypothetical protein
MSIHEQQLLREKYYGEAIRYMDNAKECLVKANREGKFFHDQKYVKAACGIAYSGVLVALDCFLILKDIHKPKGKERKSIEYYQNNLGKLDKKMMVTLNCAYQILHLSGYYDGVQSVNVIKEGFDFAYTIIEKIKPS